MSVAFEVLAHPLRRDILGQLSGGPRSVGELVEALAVTQPTMSKHLRVLREAGFVTASVEAQRRLYALRAEPLVEVAEWLEPYRWLWEHRLDLLGEQLDTMAAEEKS